MDVLRPPIIRIGNRSYRKNPTNQNKPEEFEEENDFQDSEYADEECYEEEMTCNFEKTSQGYKMSLAIPSEFFKFIIGRRGETKQRLEDETRTQIKIPRQGKEGDIEITGPEKQGISSAVTRINMMVDSAREKLPFTHFLSLPMAGTKIKDRFLDFTEEVLESCGEYLGVERSIFQNPDKLHLTLGTLVLLNEDEKQMASQLLQETGSSLIQSLEPGQSLRVRMRGLEYMNDDPGSVDVLYAKVHPLDGSDSLQSLADTLVGRFREDGKMQRDYDRVKLHITVMNTVFRRNRDKMAKRESFDARNILKMFGDYDFGVHHIDTVQISERYTTDPDGYYASSGKFTLP